MQTEALVELVRATLAPLGGRWVEGEEFAVPALAVLGYHARTVRVGPLPWLGRAQSVVMVAAEPADLPATAAGWGLLWERLARVAGRRFGPRGGPGLALTAVVVAHGPPDPADEAALAASLRDRPRLRAVPLGLFRVHPAQEAVSFALRRGPDGLFPEPERLADALAARLRRFVPPLPPDVVA